MVAILFIVTQSLYSQDSVNYRLPQVIVESSRLSLSQAQMNRSTTVIDSTTFHTLAPQSVEEALRLFSTVELRRRGAMGIQTDIGVRGSTFSQQAILLDGIRINDPQTAHHNFDIPLVMNSVKQIEIVRGPSSSHFGPDAFGGIVNIVTSPGAPGASLQFAGGEKGYLQGGANYGFTSGQFHSTTGVQYEKSDGYRYDTEFENMMLSSINSMDLDGATLHLFLGYVKKDFGAFDFYSPGFNIPSHEKTQTAFTSFGADFGMGGWNITSNLSYRHHFDDFIYKIFDPEYSHNKHNTNVYTVTVSGRRALSSSFIFEPSLEFNTDNINSTKLGVHQRQFAAVSAITRWYPVLSLSIDAGVRFDAHSDFENQIHPVVSAGYFLNDRNKVYASFGTSFRAPSYTDLYYSDPTTVGNPKLKPETGTSYEAGYHFFSGSALQASAAYFYRTQKNLIDYVQFFSGDIYHAENFSEATIQGAELQATWISTRDSSFFRSASVGYTFIESELGAANVFRAQYSLTHPKHQIDGAITFGIPFEALITFGGSYAHRSNYTDQSSFNFTWSRKFDYIDVIIKITNIFNQPYEEIPGIPLPGRWAIGTVRWNVM